MAGEKVVVAFWSGRGIVPLLVRALTYRPGLAWHLTPAHVSVYRQQENGLYTEIEAVVTGVRECHDQPFPLDCCWWFVLGDPGGRGWAEAERFVGEPYGFAAALLTGAAGIVGLRDWATQWWRKLGEGRTAPQDCATLAARVIEAAGLEVPDLDVPVSPADLMRFLKGVSI